MNKREKQLETECKALYRELQAMEQLIQRYQEKLAATESDNRFQCHCNPQNVRDWYRFEEVLFEYQILSSRGYPLRNELPVMCRVSGEEMQFHEVKLPSKNWEWVSDWQCDIHAYTDESGWMSADSWELPRDMNKSWHSEQSTSSRVRQRRWKRERMLVGSTGLPLVLNENLLTKSRLASMVRIDCFVNFKFIVGVVTDVASEIIGVLLRSNTLPRSLHTSVLQLLRANERIEELEHCNKIYEGQMLKFQKITDELMNDLYARTFDQHDSIAMPYNMTKSADVLKQTEALLGDMLVEQGLARFDTLAITSTMQQQRSEVLTACENELQHTMNEFNDLARKLERTQSSSIEQAELEADRPI
ncbi:hypothetical protein DD237_003567 [Peronospora effusa]|uniref:Peroxin domain-containing protein n=1 Tax=Peronospora effusa TaxID=542832 RepID=A0A425BXG1_9STRA|nr:hypothetical protein DD237_003567 [Peronospora effusa]